MNAPAGGRQRMLVGNWKMNGDGCGVFAVDWAGEFAQLIDAARQESERGGDEVRVVVCPPMLSVLTMCGLYAGEGVQAGAQNVAASMDAAGALTGEVSAAMLAEAGCTLTLVGHSERRAMGEDDAACAIKLRAAAAAGLTAALCVGEDAATRARGGQAAADAVLAQVAAALAGGEEALWRNVAVAYEPVWAIGAGKTPTADEVSAMHGAIRGWLMQENAAFGGKISLLYGGSVSPANASALIACDNVDGFLVGGASLKPQDFIAIYRAFP